MTLFDTPTKERHTTATFNPTALSPFHVEIPAEALVDLRGRLDATRLPAPELDPSQRVQLATIQALVRYWSTEDDFGRLEVRLNALPQFTTEIDGLGIHFIHVKSTHENALPLLITHGWPGSGDRLLDVIGLLTDPKAFGGCGEDASTSSSRRCPGTGSLDSRPRSDGVPVASLTRGRS